MLVFHKSKFPLLLVVPFCLLSSLFPTNCIHLLLSIPIVLFQLYVNAVTLFDNPHRMIYCIQLHNVIWNLASSWLTVFTFHFVTKVHLAYAYQDNGTMLIYASWGLENICFSHNQINSFSTLSMPSIACQLKVCAEAPFLGYANISSIHNVQDVYKDCYLNLGHWRQSKRNQDRSHRAP